MVPLLEVVEDELTCPVCLNIFNQSERMPKQLPCPYGHTFCFECIKNFASARGSDNGIVRYNDAARDRDDDILDDEAASDWDDDTIVDEEAARGDRDIDNLDDEAASEWYNDIIEDEEAARNRGIDIYEDDETALGSDHYIVEDDEETPRHFRCPVCRAELVLTIAEMELWPNNQTIIALLDKANRQVTSVTQSDTVSVSCVM